MIQRELVICLGRTGTGKTRLLHQEVLRRVRELHAADVATLVVVHDTRLPRPGGWDHSAIGCIAPERARYRTVRDMLAAATQGDDGETRHASFVNAVYEDDPLQLFALANARRESGRATLLVIDELDQTPERLVRSRPDHAAAYKCLHYGRVGPVDILATMRQPQRVDPAWLALATKVHAFQLTGDLQLARIKASGWPDAERVAAELPKLAPFHFMSIEPGGPGEQEQ
jgi:hypothetical protein